MFAIAFDLIVEEAQARHPRSLSAAYGDIERILARFHFERAQGSLFVTREEDLSNLFFAVAALRALPWFPDTVRDIRPFRIDLWSNLTAYVKEP
jgi:virulence-associated protein VapD